MLMVKKYIMMNLENSASIQRQQTILLLLALDGKVFS